MKPIIALLVCSLARPFLNGYDWSIICKEPNHIHRKIFSIDGELKCGCESDI